MLIHRLVKLAVVAALVSSSLASLAQDGPSAKEILLGRRIFTAFRKEVREELKITEPQLKKIEDAMEGCVQVDGDHIRVELNGDQDLAAMEKKGLAALELSQRQRLEEIWIQGAGATAAADEATGKKLGVSADQSKKIDKILEDVKDQIMELMMEGPSEENAKKATKMREDCGKKVEAVLTEEQLKKLEELKGKPFKFKKKDGNR